jgi:hypothetical protein
MSDWQAAFDYAVQTQAADRIRTDYPSLAWLLDADPEVRSLLLEAFDPNFGFDSEAFAAKLYATNWWKTTAETTRQWDAMRQLDPATAGQRIDQLAATIQDMANQMFGSQFLPTVDDAKSIAGQALRFGWDENQIRDALVNFQTTRTDGAPYRPDRGQWGAAYQDITAKSERWMVGVTDEQKIQWANDLMSGRISAQEIDVFLKGQAYSKFPQLKFALDQGITPGQFFDPYRQQIGELFGVNPAQVDLMRDPNFQDIISYNDNGQIRPMTLAEAARHARRHFGWGETDVAKKSVASLGDFLTRTFGEVA